MFINEAKTNEMQKTEKYQEFVRWAKSNGALISDEVCYPAAFGDQGFTGIAAVKDIPANKVIIAIPNKLIISANKVYNSELREIFEANPNFFDDEKTTDAEFNSLALFILWHKLLGKESFWYPYLNVVEQHTMFEWRVRDVCSIQDEALVDEFIHVQKEMEKTWHQLKQVIGKYPKFYPNFNESHKDLFYWSCEFVMTRCFGWTIPSTSLIPYADMLNHSTEATTYHLIKLDYEKALQAANKYSLKSERVDLTLLGVKEDAQNLQRKHTYLTPKQAYIATNSLLSTLEEGGEIQKINQINYNVLKLWPDKQIWELDFESSSNSEDNDEDSESESDEEEGSSAKEDKLIQLKQSELRIIRARRANEQEKMKQKQVEDCSKVLSSLLPETLTRKKATAANTAIPQIKGRQNTNLSREQREAKSEAGQKPDTKIIESDQVSESDSEKDFDWFEEEDDEIYFCITTSGPIKKGEQIYTFYGRRNNKFLLLWYGFCIPKNKYNSFYYRIWLNQEPMPFNDQIYRKILYLGRIKMEDIQRGQVNGIPLTQLSRELKLKGTKLSDDLLIHLRIFLMGYYVGKDANDILLTVPASIPFELFVFDFAIKMLSYLVQKFKTTYHQDLVSLQNKNLSAEIYFSTQHNADIKEAILLQLQHLKETQKLLQFRQLNPEKNLKDYYMQLPNAMERISPIRNYIKYL